MSTYSNALDAYLSSPDHREADLAEAVGTTQASVNRWRNGKRFPDAKTARDIDEATKGQVAFAVWQADFLDRSGLGEAA